MHVPFHTSPVRAEMLERRKSTGLEAQGLGSAAVFFPSFFPFLKGKHV